MTSTEFVSHLDTVTSVSSWSAAARIASSKPAATASKSSSSWRAAPARWSMTQAGGAAYTACDSNGVFREPARGPASTHREPAKQWQRGGSISCSTHDHHHERKTTHD